MHQGSTWFVPKPEPVTPKTLNFGRGFTFFKSTAGARGLPPLAAGDVAGGKGKAGV